MSVGADMRATIGRMAGEAARRKPVAVNVIARAEILRTRRIAEGAPVWVEEEEDLGANDRVSGRSERKEKVN